jgi:hypothetical protein
MAFAGCTATQQGDSLDTGDEPKAGEQPDDAPLESERHVRERKALIMNSAVAGAVAVYGLRFWDYGGVKFQTTNEGWFGRNTAYGGADKLGHLYSTYLATLGFANIYEHWGYDRRDADLYGVMSAMGMFTLIEVGDGFSRNGFSFEDLIVDSAGAAFAFLRRRHPRVGEFLDLRVEYWPSRLVTDGGRKDIATDYSGFKYVAALKLEGFRALENTPLAYTEILVGYYTRGYGPSAAEFYDDTSRTLFVGIGLNMSRVLRKAGWKKAAKVFNFYQAPYTYLESDGLD